MLSPLAIIRRECSRTAHGRYALGASQRTPSRNALELENRSQVHGVFTDRVPYMLYSRSWPEVVDAQVLLSKQPVLGPGSSTFRAGSYSFES